MAPTVPLCSIPQALLREDQPEHWGLAGVGWGDGGEGHVMEFKDLPSGPISALYLSLNRPLPVSRPQCPQL